ncbi:hypothetical protein Tcan_17986 [Toxocara canis]|uniref:Uncharacterized protein n=2 Tax=Toxocara canis TaxID=6265 RepID=A0A0B2W667_TOXCA|nr:hypothetical protein Tcan_17986 [Toxocara canis]
MAQQEIAKCSGLTAGFVDGDGGNKSTAELILEEDLINLLPNVYRANSMSKELKRNVNFEIALVAPEARGLTDGLTELVNYLKDRSLYTTIWGTQKIRKLSLRSAAPSAPKRRIGNANTDRDKVLVNYLKDRSLYTTIWGTQKIRKLSLRSAAPSAPKRRIGNANTDRDKVQRVERLLDETQKVSAQTISMRAVEKALNGVTHEEEHHQDQKPKKENVAKKSSTKTRRSGSQKVASTSSHGLTTTNKEYNTAQREEKPKKRKSSNKSKKRSKSMANTTHS